MKRRFAIFFLLICLLSNSVFAQNSEKSEWYICEIQSTGRANENKFSGPYPDRMSALANWIYRGYKDNIKYCIAENKKFVTAKPSAYYKPDYIALSNMLENDRDNFITTYNVVTDKKIEAAYAKKRKAEAKKQGKEAVEQLKAEEEAKKQAEKEAAAKAAEEKKAAEKQEKADKEAEKNAKKQAEKETAAKKAEEKKINDPVVNPNNNEDKKNSEISEPVADQWYICEIKSTGVANNKKFTGPYPTLNHALATWIYKNYKDNVNYCIAHDFQFDTAKPSKDYKENIDLLKSEFSSNRAAFISNYDIVTDKKIEDAYNKQVAAEEKKKAQEEAKAAKKAEDEQKAALKAEEAEKKKQEKEQKKTAVTEETKQEPSSITDVSQESKWYICEIQSTGKANAKKYTGPYDSREIAMANWVYKDYQDGLKYCIAEDLKFVTAKPWAYYKTEMNDLKEYFYSDHDGFVAKYNIEIDKKVEKSYAKKKAAEDKKKAELEKKEAAAKAKEEAEAKKKEAAEAKKQAEEEKKAAEEAKKKEELEKKEAAAKAKEEAEAKKKEAAEAKKQADEEKKVSEEAKKKEELEKKEAAAKAKEEAEAKKKADAEAKKQAELEKKEAAAKAKEEAEAKKKAAAEAKKQAELEKKEAAAKAKEEAEAKKTAESEAKKKAAEQEKLEAEAKKEAEEKAKIEAAEKLAKEELRKSEEEARKLEEERKLAEAEEKAEKERILAAQEAEKAERLAAEEKRKQEEKIAAEIEAEAKRQAEMELKAAQEAEKIRIAAEEAAKQKAEAEEKLKAEKERQEALRAETEKRAAEDKAKADAEAKRKAEEEADKKAKEEKARIEAEALKAEQERLAALQAENERKKQGEIKIPEILNIPSETKIEKNEQQDEEQPFVFTSSASKSVSRYKKEYLQDYVPMENYVPEELESSLSDMLIENPNEADLQGQTLLMKAAKSGNEWQIKTLLNSGADVSLTDKDGWTALMYACRYQESLSTVKTLVDANSNVKQKNNYDASALTLAASYNNNPEILNYLLNFYNVSEKDVLKSFILLLSSKQYSEYIHIAKVNIYLRKSIPLNIFYQGKTPLMYAAKYGNSTQVLKLLIDNDALTNIRSTEGKTAFDYAKANTSLNHDENYWALNSK